MDLFSILKGSPERQIQRARKKVKEPHGDSSIRINAARKLCEIGTEDALLALLERFTINVSPSTQDEVEKEEVLSWLLQFGGKAVNPIIRFLKRERRVYWPMRALRELLPEDELAAKVDEVLIFHWENPPADSEPISQLIRSVGSLYSPALQETICRFLEHEDDDVVLAALEYLFSRNEEEMREKVLQVYLDSEERPRIRTQILDKLVESGWTVRGFRGKFEETLPEGYILTREGKVKSVGKNFS